MTRFLLRLIFMLILGSALVVGLVLGAGRLLPREDELLFTSTFDGRDLEIYRMMPRHGIYASVTHNSFDEFQASWSPDGESIVFVSNRGGTSAIYTMDAHGSHVSRLTEGQIGDYSPVWSPDGQSIVFVSDRYPRSRELMLFNVATGMTRRLTEDDSLDNNPTWSPDSQQIVFNATRQGGNLNNIYMFDIQSGAVRPLFTSVDQYRYPIWSPDGRYIVYLKGTRQTNMYVWDTEQQRDSLLYTAADVIPNTLTWSVNSRFIVFSSTHVPLTYSPAQPLNVTTQLYQIDVAACLQNPQACTSQSVAVIDSFFTNTRWRPTTP